MATRDAAVKSDADAERVRTEGLRLVTSSSAQAAGASTDSFGSSSSRNSAHPLQSPLNHALPPLFFPPGAPSGRRGAAKPPPAPNRSTSGSVSVSTKSSQGQAGDLRQRQTQAMAWLYDYDGGPEDDDWLHDPGVERPRSWGRTARGVCSLSARGLCNLGSLLLLTSALLMLFAGYPILQHFLGGKGDRKAATFFGLGGTNGSGQVPLLPGLFSLIDTDTPQHKHTWTNPVDNAPYHLVFSDEFNVEGRTFWPGDDPFWEAVDLHYWATGDYEWYSAEAINTTGGFLNVWMTETDTHNLNFQSGMLQSWNKFCFQGGYIETSVVLPGTHDGEGFWPAVWMLGNLGRAGYAGTTQGMWPYSYSTCDVGTLANQTNADKTAPAAALNAHGLYSDSVGNKISFLEGQRTSACTCPGEDHPGPHVGVGRSAPEIDMFETQVNGGHGAASQSFQIAPFDANYTWSQAPDVARLHSSATTFNSYTGGQYQEAVSGVTQVPDTAYALSGAQPVTMGVQYDPDWSGTGDGSITWFVDGKPTWTLTGHALAPNPFTEIGQRIIPTEPVSIVINLALSDGFQRIKWNQLSFPAVMKLDYIRVYQKDGQQDRISCDPPDHPTAKYIHDHPDLYTNNNYTVFPQDKYRWPKNSLLGC